MEVLENRTLIFFQKRVCWFFKFQGSLIRAGSVIRDNPVQPLQMPGRTLRSREAPSEDGELLMVLRLPLGSACDGDWGDFLMADTLPWEVIKLSTSLSWPGWFVGN